MVVGVLSGLVYTLLASDVMFEKVLKTLVLLTVVNSSCVVMVAPVSMVSSVSPSVSPQDCLQFGHVLNCVINLLDCIAF